MPPPDSRASSQTPADDTESRRRSYGQILKSSVLIGGSSALNIAFGIVRAKAVAVMLGPSGFGFMGLYTSILNLAQSIAGMGINASGVRQIAAAAASGDAERVGRTALVLRRVSWLLGLAGGAVVVALARPISVLTFGDAEAALPVAVLSVAVLLRVVGDGQGALIQGLRRIADLATLTVLGGLAGTLLTIAIVAVWRTRGIAPSLVAAAGASLVFSFWYSRRLSVASARPTWSQVRREASGLLRLGFAFMASGVLMMGAAYAVRLFIVRQAGIEAAGLYNSAWTVGGMYVNFILQAMGADFYPRLTGAIADHAECNRLVNEQALVSLLLAGPGVLATMTFAPLVLAVFYSGAFLEAVPALRWICLGATLQVMSWPLGFIIVAEGKQGIFLAAELLYTAVYIPAAWVLVRVAGADGAGIAFFISYAAHLFIVYPIVRWRTGFRWSAGTWRLGLTCLGVVGLVFLGFAVLPPWLASTAGALALAVSAIVSLRALARMVPPDRIPGPLRRVLAFARVLPPAP